MLSFLNPWFLVAGAAALVPLVLHLIQSNRTVQLPFSTIRFLKLAAQRSSRRIKMEHLLLWLMRTLLMLLLALAFAMPMLRTKSFGNILGRSQRDVALVIDTSYSMHYVKGRGTVWQDAVAAATGIIEGLSDQDRFCIYLADEDVTPLIEQLSGDRQEALEHLKALKPTYTSSQLAPAVVAANNALEQEARRREREIHIITDNQALPWDRFGREAENAAGGSVNETAPDAVETAPPSAVHWDPTRIAGRTAVFVTLLGVPAPENIAPADAELNPSLIMADTPSQVEVRFAHSGPPRNSTVRLFVDDREVARRSTVIGGETGGDLAFAIPPLPFGRHAARIETPADNLAEDNAFHFLLRVRESLPSLCVGSGDDTLFLRAALGAGKAGKSAIEAKRVGIEQLAEEELREYACVFLCNAFPVPGQDVVRLEDYVRAGGLLVIFPGNRASAGDYAAWRCLPGVPSAITDVSVANRNQMLRWVKPTHPLLRDLRAGAAAPTLTIRRSLAWATFPEEAEILISSEASNPFLVIRPFGSGQVALFAVAADRTWSDFPLSPFYLPIGHQTVQFGAGVGSFKPYVWGSASLSLGEYLPEASRESTLLAPDGRRVPLRSAVVAGKTVLHAEDMVTPGVYSISSPRQASTGPSATRCDTTRPTDPSKIVFPSVSNPFSPLFRGSSSTSACPGHLGSATWTTLPRETKFSGGDRRWRRSCSAESARKDSSGFR